MYPYPIITIGSLRVYLYGVLIAIGLLACFAVLFTYTKKLKIDSKFVDFLFYNGMVSIVIGFLGASLFQAFYNYLENPAEGFNFGQGMTFIGGLIFGVITFLVIYFIVQKKLTGSLFDALSYIPCCILIAHGFGRIGCFFSGCCYGIETDSFLGVKFPGLENPVHPTMLYEAAYLFLMFAVCTYLLFKFKFRYNMPLYLGTYGVFRFLIEFVRGDDRGSFIPGVSPSQFWSILMVVAAIGLFFAMRFVYQKRDAMQNSGEM